MFSLNTFFSFSPQIRRYNLKFPRNQVKVCSSWPFRMDVSQQYLNWCFPRGASVLQLNLIGNYFSNCRRALSLWTSETVTWEWRQVSTSDSLETADSKQYQNPSIFGLQHCHFHCAGIQKNMMECLYTWCLGRC